ncbi:hypothetical protein CU097_009094 [Rhizopus azygosporus]|uniref:t-SNARE coiled-coil homology domain-containing protein n=1 Tax=Rhizopus azygosporus TaxID=86630 RepID=A0A367JD65_RHIAZ|nr:hypothetical protein CU097_009094 [Rhizopus azygosporus]
MSRQFGSRSVRSYQNLHNRTALLGDAKYDRNTPSPSREFDSVKVKMNDYELDYLESQNDEDISGLSAKVKILKNITGKIGEEIKYGNSLIDSMNSQFSNTGSILGLNITGTEDVVGIRWYAECGGIFSCTLVSGP